jgi:hypothetical protein
MSLVTASEESFEEGNSSTQFERFLASLGMTGSNYVIGDRQ